MKKRDSEQITITKTEFADLTGPILNLPVAHVWRGFGSAIFLEIGALTEKKFKSKTSGEEWISYRGEYGVMIEWSWRVERPRSIYFGSWSTDKVINNRLTKLKDRVIRKIDVEGRLPELNIELSDRLWVHSFSTTDGQTQWCLFLRKNSLRQWLKSENGKLIKETVIG